MSSLMSLFSKTFLVVYSHLSYILFKKIISLCWQICCWMLHIEGLLFFSLIQLVIHTKQERIPMVLVKALNVSSCFPIGLKFNQRIVMRGKKNSKIKKCTDMLVLFLSEWKEVYQHKSLHHWLKIHYSSYCEAKLFILLFTASCSAILFVMLTSVILLE